MGQLVLCLMTLALLCIIAAKKQYRRIVVHTNFKVLFVNVSVLCGLVSVFTSIWVLRFQISHLSSHSEGDGCSLLVPVRFSILVRVPTYIYGTGFPLWHVSMTVERLLSTMQASKYEHARPSYSIACSVIVWLVTIGHTAYAACVALQDPGFQGEIAYATLTTATNASFLTLSGQVLLVVDLLAMALDFVTVLLNRRLLKKVTPQYSLSRSYQISENLLVTKRLVLPLDICNAVCYVLYQSGITTARYLRSSLEPHRFQSLIEVFYMLVLFQAPITLVCLILYAKNQKRKPTLVRQADEAALYFSQLRNQLGADQSASLLSPR